MNNNKKFFILDIETTGLPQRPPGRGRGMYPFHQIDRYDGCRIVSIAWIVMNSEFDQECEEYHIVKPIGFAISKEVAAIHGISHDKAMAEGIDFDEIVSKLEKTFNKYDLTHVVAHNIEFDVNIIKSELYRAEAMALLSKFKKLVEICTMKETCRYMIGGKYPRLAELYALCFDGKKLENAHDALHDTRNCAACFVHLVKSKMINIEREY